MYQGSHLPNFEALGVPKKKAKRGQTDGQTNGRHRIIP